MAGRFKKGAIPHDPSIVIPKLEDYIEWARSVAR